MNHLTKQKFSIRDYEHLLEPTKGGKYICPNCGGHNFSIRRNSDQYNCWNCGDTKAIKELLTSAGDQPIHRERSPQQQQSHRQIWTPQHLNKHIRDTANLGGLDSLDRQDLEKRGLTAERIDAHPFFSCNAGVQRWKPTPPEIYSEFASYAVPGYNRQGLAHSLQLRMHLPPGAEGKYRFISKFPRPRENKAPLTYLPEQPWRSPHFPTEAIAYCDGYLKAIVTNEKQGIPITGWGAGSLKSNPNQATENLEGYAIAIWFPDAGDITNHGILLKAQNNHQFVRQQGLKSLVAWWGQVGKKGSHPDCDELESLQGIQLLTWEEFWAIALEHCPDLRPPPKQKEPDPDRELEPDPQLYQEYQQRLELEEAIASQEEERRRQEREAANWRAWRYRKNVDPDIELFQRYLGADIPFPRAGEALAIKSPMGTGKTFWMGEQLKHQQQGRFFGIGHRNSTLKQSAGRWGAHHLQTELAHDPKVGKALAHDPNTRVVFCIESLLHVPPECFENSTIVLDEIESLLNQLHFGGTTVKKFRRQIKARLGLALKDCDRLICMDGNLKRSTIRWVKAVSGKNVTVVRNTYHVPFNFNWYEGTWDNEKIKNNCRLAIVQKLLETTAEGPICVCSDSQKFLEMLETLLKDLGLHGYRADSEGSQQSWFPKFLESPNNWIKDNQINYLLYSPSCDAGIDISLENYFIAQFCIFTGVLLVDGITQMIRRLRDPNCPRHLFVALRGLPGSEKISRATTPEELKHEWNLSVLENFALCNFEQWQQQQFEQLLKATANNPSYQWQSEQAALENFEQKQLREVVLRRLVDEGNPLSCQLPIAADIEFLKHQCDRAKQTVITRHCQGIFDADDITPEQADQLQAGASSGLALPDKWSIIKCRIKQSLPGIEQSQHWEPKLIEYLRFDNRDRISQLLLFLQLTKFPELAKRKHLSQWEKVLHEWIEARETIENPNQLNTMHSKIVALQDLGIADFLDEEACWDCDSYAVKRAYSRGQRPRNQRALGVRVGKLEPVQYVNRVLKKLGLTTRSRRRTIDGKLKRIYKLEPLNEYDVAVKIALEKRLENELADSSQTLAVPSLEPDPPGDNHLYIKQAAGGSPPGVTWAMGVLADLEAIACGQTRPQFPNCDAAFAAFEQMERLPTTFWEQFERLIPKERFWHRMAIAIGEVSERLPSRESPPEVQFCWQQLVRLEADDPTIENDDQLIELTDRVERQFEAIARPYLPTDYCERFVRALARVSERVSNWGNPITEVT